ncbi:hypothetical protein [Franzmannia qiaohouensis]|uniref:Uncharacterized protein n=1 Tax=Franzmannia qiaohouensis TaxID=1329370 RepID=A0ABU1H9N0_9GAMM|nr:hypothetical protein [Halomonas qiaohouensis]MDR5904002.1 hypothetical protein [Halomonas qiaohouensis]
MTATVKSKATAAADSWTAWLEQLEQLQAERAETAGLHDARQRLERARSGIQFLIDKAWNNSLTPIDLDRAAMRGDESAQNARAVLRGDSDEGGDHHAAATFLLGLLSKASRRDDWKNQPEERRTFITGLETNLRDAIATLEQANGEVTDLEQARAAVDQRLEALEKKAPKVSASSLALLGKERDAAAEQRDRLAAALESLAADDSPLALAREAERTAQERLEEAEALVAMGEANTEEEKAAREEAKRASQALEQQQAEHRRQEAARRGMARKLEQADSHLDTLSRAYREALARVRHAELAALETELVADLEALASDRLARLAQIYRDLAEAEPGNDYGTAVMKVKLPHFYHHERRSELNSAGLVLGPGSGKALV